jgi:hypothetical protein
MLYIYFFLYTNPIQKGNIWLQARVGLHNFQETIIIYGVY